MDFYVADTNTIVWFLAGSPRLGAATKRLLLNRNSHIVVSVAALEDLRMKDRRASSRQVDTPPPLVAMKLLDCAKNVCVYPQDSTVTEEALRLQCQRPRVDNDEDRLHLATFLILDRLLHSKGHRVHFLGTDVKILDYLRAQGYENCIFRCDR